MYFWSHSLTGMSGKNSTRYTIRPRKIKKYVSGHTIMNHNILGLNLAII